MSLVGIDLGCDTSKVAVVRQGGIDVLMNTISKRETAAMIGFGKGERLIGEAAASVHAMNGPQTVTDIRMLLGKRFAEPAAQAELSSALYRSKADSAGNVAFEMLNGEKTVQFGVPSAVAMLLSDQKGIAERALGLKVTECVINVPGYATQAERLAMLDAASIAQLKPLELMNSTTACALSYGFYKTDIEDASPLRTMFVDIGAGSYEVAIVSFTKSKLEVLGYASDRTFGGRNFTQAIVDHFVAAFEKSPGINVRTNPKAMLRLTQACEKMKKVLTSNPEAHLSIECLMNDRDVKGVMTRDNFEALCAPFVSKIAEPIARALAQAGLTAADLGSVELLGGGTRVLAARAAIEAAVGRPISDTMPKDESVARGCALRCAQLSPIIRMRAYEIVDKANYSIVFTAPTEAAPLNVIAAGEACGKAKGLNFVCSNRLELTASYATEPYPGADAILARYIITGFPENSVGDHKVKVKVIQDASGLLVVPWARIIEETLIDVEETVTPPADPAAPADAPAPAPQKTIVKKKKTKEIELQVEVHQRTLSKTAMMEALDVEAEMQARDLVIRETAEAKNNVESYIYDMRAKIRDGEALASYMTPSDRDSFAALLQSTEDWLYEDGEDAKKSVYVETLERLRAAGDPALARMQDAEARPDAVRSLEAAANEGLVFAASTDERFAHIEAPDRTIVREACAAALSWCAEQVRAQAALAKTDNPAAWAKDFVKRERELTKAIKPIMAKPKPKPKAPEPAPAPAPAPAPEAGASPAEAGAPPAGEPEPTGVPEPGNVD